MRRLTLKQQVEKRIAASQEDAFLTREFSDLGGEDQVIRALRQLVREGKLVHLGYGVYSRAVISRLSGRPILSCPFERVSRQALTKLGVKWEPTAAEKAYNAGRTTQIPVNPAVRVKGRFSRRLRYNNTEMRIEH